MTRSRPQPRGFTLVEMAVVIAIVGVLAAVAAPALNALAGVRAGAAAEEIERRLVTARATAIARGRPTGLQLDPAAGTIRMWEIAATGAAPTPALSPLGEPEPAWGVAERYPGIAFTLVGGGGATGVQTIWFAFDGTPQTRSGTGALSGAWTQDAVVTVTGGHTVYVRRGSGAVER